MVGATPKFNRPIADGYKNLFKRRRMIKQIRKKNKGVKVIPVADPELMTSHILKKRGSNPRANITLSGKKKRKLLKRLQRNETEKLNMEVENTKSQTRKKKRNKKRVEKQDVEMKEA